MHDYFVFITVISNLGLIFIVIKKILVFIGKILLQKMNYVRKNCYDDVLLFICMKIQRAKIFFYFSM